MTRYLLDTNIVSNITKLNPSQPLLDWLAAKADDDLFISTLTLAEIRRGILEKPTGKKRRELEAWFTGPEGPQSLFQSRILAFDEQSALIWARVMAEGTAHGKPRSAIDMLVASIAIAHECIVVTANERHFQGIPRLNPLRRPE